MKRSIRARLLVWLLAVLVPLSAGAAWLLIQAFGDRLLHDLDVSLREEAETITELLQTSDDGGAVGSLLVEIAGEPGGTASKYIVVWRDGEVIAEVPAGAQARLRSPAPDIRVVRYQSPNGSLMVSIAASAAAALHAKQRLTSLLAVGVPATLLLVSAALWWLVGRALSPLQKASQRIECVGADQLEVRVAVDNPDDEVGRMVTVLNRMLDRLAGAVSELQRFTADAAHELRTPLAVLRAGLEVSLARERSAEEYRGALRDALAGTARLARLADDLLTLARLDTAATPRAPETVDLSEVLHELADAAAERAAERQQTVTVEAPAGLWVSGNSGDLYRLFSNLLDNALHHGFNGTTGRILLSAQRSDGRIRVGVADHGPGIAAADLGRVFERFSRGQSARAEASGAGLGLSIAREIVRTHGGQITAENREGGGCVITVTLPAVR